MFISHFELLFDLVATVSSCSLKCSTSLPFPSFGILNLKIYYSTCIVQKKFNFDPWWLEVPKQHAGIPQGEEQQDCWDYHGIYMNTLLIQVNTDIHR